jgi:hypothetical protein
MAQTVRVPSFADDRNRPSAQAVAASIHEKGQILAPDRARSGLPLTPGKCRTITRNERRGGMTISFAAPDLLGGKAIGRGARRHRRRQFIRLLDAVERAGPAREVIPAIDDGYVARQQFEVLKWLADHLPWAFRFTPTSASRHDAVEGFSSAVTRRPSARRLQLHRRSARAVAR